MKEEIGINQFTIKNFIDVCHGYQTEDKVSLFNCETDEQPQLMEPHKFSTYQWIDLNNLPENFLDNFAFINQRIYKSLKNLNY